MQGSADDVRLCSKQYTNTDAHKWNDIKLEDVDSILDCNRPDTFYNLNVLCLLKDNTDCRKHKMWNLVQFVYAILYITT